MVEPANTVRQKPEMPSRQDYDACHQTIAPGDHYGLEFPFTMEQLSTFGAAFLTAAFRASGVLSDDNAVITVDELNPVTIYGASERALLTVSYLRDAPGLQTQLFIKFPSADPDFKFMVAPMAKGEVTFQRLSCDANLPIAIPKYYFGDHCARTTNFILITEQIGYGQDPIEKAHRKGFDHEIAGVEAYYELLTLSLARLVAAHKTGAIAADIERLFPFGAAARDFDPIADAEARVDRLIAFVSGTAKHLFIPEATDPQFLERWRADLLFGVEHKDAVIDYLHANPDYTGLCHPNLNVDNAWFWRDEAGQLNAGLIDWGGAGQMSVAQALSSMLMMPQPEKYQQLALMIRRTFIGELGRLNGIELDADELRLQYKSSLYSTAICTILTNIVDLFGMYSADEWASMKDRYDARMLEHGMIAAIEWIENMLREWTEPFTPGDACREIVARRKKEL